MLWKVKLSSEGPKYVPRNRMLIPLAAIMLASVATGCAKSQHEIEHMRAARAYTPTLEDAAKAYTETCAGGDRLSNNCAHFLSDAFLRAGFTELETSELITERCPHGRAIRAQDMLRWFQQKKDRFQNGRPEPNTGYWACYQEKRGRRHVTIIDSDTGKFYGTDDCKEWPVQYSYQW